MSKIRINLLHPTNPSEILTVAVPQEATASWLIDEMVKAGFIPRANAVGQYKLQDTRTEVQLNDNQSLASARIQDGSNLRVNHATSGALP
jgi:type VII secretion system (Wss) protein YukD